MAATWDPGRRSWDITLWSSRATRVTLVIADRLAPTQVTSSFEMSRSGDAWRATLTSAAIGDADLYGFRVEGDGARFDPAKLLLDPEAVEVWFPDQHDRDAARAFGTDTFGIAPFGVLPMPATRPPMPRGPRHRPDELIIYEVHVRGLTMRDPSIAGHPQACTGDVRRAGATCRNASLGSV